MLEAPWPGTGRASEISKVRFKRDPMAADGVRFSLFAAHLFTSSHSTALLNSVFQGLRLGSLALPGLHFLFDTLATLPGMNALVFDSPAETLDETSFILNLSNAAPRVQAALGNAPGAALLYITCIFTQAGIQPLQGRFGAGFQTPQFADLNGQFKLARLRKIPDKFKLCRFRHGLSALPGWVHRWA